MASEPQHSLQDQLAIAEARVTAAIDAVMTIDAAGVVVDWNPAAERTFGYTTDEAMGRTLAELIIPDELRSAHKAGMDHYLATGEGPVLDQRIELPAVNKAGDALTLEITITAFEVGGERLFTGWARDISELVAAREEIARNEQRFQSIVEHSSDVITILDGDGTWRYTSAAGARLTGFGKGLDPDGGIFSLLHPDDVDKANQAMADLVAGTLSPEDAVELRIIGADSEVRYFETVGVNLLEDDAVGGLVLHARDVTERLRSERELALRTTQLEGIITNLQAGVVVEDDAGTVRLVNRAFLKMFPHVGTSEDVVGKQANECVAGMCQAFTDPATFMGTCQQRSADKTLFLNEAFEMDDGRFIERDYIPVLTGDDVGSQIWVFRDVSDRVRSAQERERLLEAEREQNRILREVDEMKTELVATVSHELRTPLTSIVSFGELLTDPDAGDLNETQVEFAETIQRNAKRLMALVDDLLLLARLESKHIELDLRPRDLAAVVAESTERLQPIATAKSIDIVLTAQDGPHALIDSQRIEQLVDNLVSNAVKFTPEGGTVEVQVLRGEDAWEIAVVDTGIGIPEEEVGDLFQRFFRASNARRQMISGTGLGLAVCKALAELHTGTISVVSIEGKGTTFSVTLPDQVASEDDDG